MWRVKCGNLPYYTDATEVKFELGAPLLNETELQ